MKKNLKLSLIFSVLAMFFMGCSRDEATPTIQEQLEGTWALESTYYKGQTLSDECTKKERFIFEGGTRMYLKSYRFVDGVCKLVLDGQGTYTVDDKSIVFKRTDRYDEFFYKLDGDILVLSYMYQYELAVLTLKRQN